MTALIEDIIKTTPELIDSIRIQTLLKYVKAVSNDHHKSTDAMIKRIELRHILFHEDTKGNNGSIPNKIDGLIQTNPREVKVHSNNQELAEENFHKL